jgi:ubiquinone/menaquinone biosynthesis C-methylase UbiE
MKKRLRSKHTEEALKRIYSKPHDHNNWHDHLIRVEATKQVAKWMFEGQYVADLSCGNAEIARSLNAKYTFLGDFAPGYQFEGPIEKTIKELPDVEMFICSETLEHLDDPDFVLKEIRKVTNKLILSTPMDNWNDPNEEHYWAWSKSDVEVMLRLAGFSPEIFMSIELPNYLYNYQIWGCY